MSLDRNVKIMEPVRCWVKVAWSTEGNAPVQTSRAVPGYEANLADLLHAG
jgi:hypothetical protein